MGDYERDQYQKRIVQLEGAILWLQQKNHDLELDLVSAQAQILQMQEINKCEWECVDPIDIDD